MNGKLLAGEIRSAILFGLVMMCFVTLSSPRPGVAKKNKEKVSERLQALQVVHVVGEGPVAGYVKRNLEQQTCLREPEENEGAEAVLTVSQRIWPCNIALSGMCLSVSATLTDPQTDKVLWYRTDDTLGNRFSVGIDEAGGKWILWNLRSSCCKKR